MIEYLKCILMRNHRFKPSRQLRGVETCTFCRHRRPVTGKAF